MTNKPADTSQMISAIVADVFQLSNLFRRWGDIIAGKSGQTQARWQVLSAASAGDRTVPQLARRLGVSRQGVQRVADLLVSDKLVRFTKNQDHQRSPYVCLTASGKALLHTLTEVASKFHQELAEGLEPADLETATIVLRKFRIQIERDLRLED